MSDAEEDKTGTPDEQIVKEARRRFKRCEAWESNARKRWIEDIKFANADSDNLWQWPGQILTQRGDRPCLTVNKVRQHNLQIINDAKQNKPSVSVKPVGNEATFESAEVFEGIIRRIEYVSNAQSAYDRATTFQVEGGIGYIRLVTDYAGDDSFDQEIFIRPVKNPLNIYLDPDIREADGSDAAFGFAFDDMAKEEAEAAYPRYKQYMTADPLGNSAGDDPGDWLTDERVRVAEYFRRVQKPYRLMAFTNPQTGEQSIVKETEVPKELLALVSDDPQTKFREVVENEVERFLIIGAKIAERSIWPGKYIPIIRVIGTEVIIENEMDRYGHTRAMKDPQRIYNYWTSNAVEMVALQTKAPYLAPVGSIEGLETYWERLNTENPAVLPYNQYDDKGQKLEPPGRNNPPVMAAGYIQGMQIASDELREVSGQHQADMGQPGNERSGVAIQQRQRMGDKATFHFIDNLGIAFRFLGKQLIDLIPKIYDTPRVMKILAEDGVEHQVLIDPEAASAYMEKQQQERDVVQAIFNPNVGTYDVEADIGPAYATRRQEAFNAMMQLASRDPEVMKLAGDLVFKAADFPMADELAQRYKKAIPPEVLGEAPPPQMVAMQQQLQQIQGTLMNTMQALQQEKAERTRQEQQKEIDIYKAVTDRMAVILKTVVSPKDEALFMQDLVRQEHGSNMDLRNATMSASMAAEAQGQAAGIEPTSKPQPQGQAPMNAPDLMAAGA